MVGEWRERARNHRTPRECLLVRCPRWPTNRRHHSAKFGHDGRKQGARFVGDEGRLGGGGGVSCKEKEAGKKESGPRMG